MKAAAILAMLVPLGLVWVDQQPRFTSTTALVRLEVSVTDERGAVRGLQSDDFVVLDKGSRQVVRVEEAADTPLDLVLVAQPIASVAYTSADQAPRMAAGLSAFLDRVQERDRLGALIAAAPPVRVRALEFGRPSFGLSAFTAGTYAAPFDAIAAALREFGESDRRRALVAFTNAADFRSTISFETLAEVARRLGPAFVLVGTPVRIHETARVKAVAYGGGDIGDMVEATAFGYVFPPRLQALARRTGGITVNLGSGDPATLIEDMFTWLRTRYVISYEPPAGKGWHPVNITVNRRGATVVAREGYIVD